MNEDTLRRAKVVFAWMLLVGCLIGWPCSIFFWATEEPVFILSLSWMALVIESVTLITSAQVRRDQD
jgi:ribose/xylose/arabinose/galactoside ABC-type transport system permease subunit